MDTAAFEAALKADGFTDIETKTVAANVVNTVHAHNFDVRLMVLEGELTVTRDGVPKTCRAGDVFTLQANCEHAERYGKDGGVVLVGRKHPA